ncbi:hypothetical protein J5N97_025247 [Dioscorea zingiberensis]|uniref:Uncharacterized protein n=1 Tax=Dioscorea zingiberensis TaxID=325984 RepID=A0A9D5C8J6_9LILI|nr:hypothetical protein J5N97_025247 [Dioscorea zingiberensis]
MQQHAIQQMLNDMMVNNRGMPQQSLSAPNVGGNVAADVIGAGGSLTPRMNTGPVRSGPMLGNSATGMPSHALGPAPSRSNSFKSATNTGAISGNSFNSRQDLPQNLHLPELDHDIVQEFAENGIFNESEKQTDNQTLSPFKSKKQRGKECTECRKAAWLARGEEQ